MTQRQLVLTCGLLLLAIGNALGQAARTVVLDPNDPEAAHAPGIYLISDKGGRQMTRLDAAVYTQSPISGMWKSQMTYGIAKAKSKAIVPGAHANVTTPDPQPVFYFYFEETIPAGAAASPTEFTILKLEKKRDTRETVVVEVSAWGSATGTAEKAVSTFKQEALRPGVYKVTLPAALPPGEYCFFTSAGMGAFGPAAPGVTRLWDFRVSPAK